MRFIKLASLLIFIITGISIYAINLPDNREVLERNFRKFDERIVKYIVSHDSETKKKYLAYFKPFFQERGVFNSLGEYETKIKEYTEQSKKLEANQPNDWTEYTFNEFKIICHNYILIKLYKEKYKLALGLYQRYENRRGNGRLLDLLEKVVYETYGTARSLFAELSGFLHEQHVLARNKAIFSIRRSYTTGSSAGSQFEQHTVGNLVKMLDVYKGKFSNLKAGIMVHLAKYQLRSDTAQTSTGYAIILNFSPIEKTAVVNKVKKVQLKVAAATGLELIKELFNSASEQMVALATIEMLQTSLSTSQWRMTGISMQDIVASKAFILGFKVLSKRSFKQTIGGVQKDMLEAIVEATIGLPKLSEITFAPHAAQRLETYRQLVRQQRQQQTQTPAVNPVTPVAQPAVQQPQQTQEQAPQAQQAAPAVNQEQPENRQPAQENSQPNQTVEPAQRTQPNASQNRNSTSNHPDLDADLPDVQARERVFKPEARPSEGALD